ncbi:uncharacterized protein LOC129907421 [Episyrphus balteatus]|uniref:uncharacterized protein LOC129907421 n=1 Tax=Episyrphus balteatus TaxID=286459 RepID=UPI0024853EA9|nr:uncharacterized protein LOC129907421 [Episyrphus balteatus]
MKIADDFAIRWQFPNCLGALDGKHIVFKSLRKDGAYYHNYKGSNSIILLALVDANCRFTFVDIGCNGRANDAGVLLQSSLKNVIDDASNRFPDDKTVGNGRILPYVIVGDDAFPLQKHLMKPYPFATKCQKKRIFNVRLSRARHVVEHAFGLLASRFRIFQTKIDLRVENVEAVTKACCVLHNFLISRNCLDVHVTETSTKSSSQNADMPENPRKGAAEEIRQKFADYFVEEGQVPWQSIQ